MSRRRQWLIGGGALVAVAVAVAAGLWLWQSWNRSATPEEAALDYLHALESGDPDAVMMTGIAVSATALDAFATATALIEDAEVTTVHVGAADAASVTVDVSFRLDGQQHKAQLTLVPLEGRWRVGGSGLGTLTADSTIGSDVAIGAATLSVGEANGLLPATYTVEAAPSTLLRGEHTVQVLPGAGAAVALDAELRPEATAAAQAQLDEYLTACTAPGTKAPEHCGIQIPWGTQFREVTSISYRIEQSPAIALMPRDFAADGGVLVATVTGTGHDGTARTTTYRTESWTLRGEVSFTADGVALSVW